MTASIRLSKRVAALRACSRREAELLIASGQVRVDGVVVETPQHRVADERVEIAANAAPAGAVTLLWHKPAGVALADGGEASAACPLEPARRWADDISGIAPLKLHFTGLTPCLPLEAEAAGLVVFTQDWRVARKLSEDAAGVEHEYVVEVGGQAVPGGLEKLNRGGKDKPAVKFSWQNENRLRVALKGARPGQVAALCASIGLTVGTLKRLRLGGVALGKVPVGEWRYLRDDERF